MFGKPLSFLFSLMTAFCLCAGEPHAFTTLLIPSRPDIERPTPPADKAHPQDKTDSAPAAEKAVEKKPADAAKTDAPAAPKTEPEQPAPQKAEGETQAPEAAAVKETEQIDQEIDVLMSLMRPSDRTAEAMDMPQLFAVLRFDADTPVRDGAPQPERRDLLGDVEEILYMGKKAWGANVALEHPGLHHFILETRPRWDETEGIFIQNFVKTIMPVYGVENGWHEAAGQHFEIVPLTRPFGLTSPSVFSGRAILEGKPAANVPVVMSRINTDGQTFLTPWHRELAARTDAAGQFSFVLNRPGWWCCEAMTEGSPLKGPDGQPRKLRMTALFWLYVDGTEAAPKKR
ncbi:MAG: DUF4198 domain-containing protein [Desulfovibrio sp.]|nr:DUF4198 domain-containing protein [Desulfovibrio sp.]